MIYDTSQTFYLASSDEFWQHTCHILGLKATLLVFDERPSVCVGTVIANLANGPILALHAKPAFRSALGKAQGLCFGPARPPALGGPGPVLIRGNLLDSACGPRWRGKVDVVLVDGPNNHS